MRRASIALAIVGILATRDAWADPSAVDRTAARTLFQDARELVKNQHYAEACPKLEESQRLDPGIGTLFNLAECYAQIGRTASAWSAYLDVAEAAKRASQRERENVARARADAIEPKLARIVLDVSGTVPHELVTFDGRDINAGSYGVAFPVDPGSHDVAASAPGKKPWSQSTSVAAQEHAKVVVPVLEDVPPEVERPPAPTVIAKPVPPRIATTSSRGWETALAYALGGASVVGLGAGAFFGLHAKSEWNTAEPDCGNGHCTSAAYDSWSSARSSATASTISFGAAAVLAGAAIVLFLTRPAEE